MTQFRQLFKVFSANVLLNKLQQSHKFSSQVNDYVKINNKNKCAGPQNYQLNNTGRVKAGEGRGVVVSKKQFSSCQASIGQISYRTLASLKENMNNLREASEKNIPRN